MTKGPEAAFQQYGRFLKALGKAELPLAMRGTLNELAYKSREQLSNVEMPRKFTLRNKFENKKSLHYERCSNTFDIDKMSSSMGQLRVVKFQKGPRPTADLFKQEHGGTVRARSGSSLLRTATKAARTGKSFNRAVAKKNRPQATGSTWMDLSDIEAKAKILNPARRSAGKALSTKSRIRRARAIMRRLKKKESLDVPFILPLIKNPRQLGVFRILRDKPVMMHKLEKGTRKLKVKETVKPAYTHIVKQTGDIFVKQAQARFDKAARRFLGLR